jgi:hypothetical protein
MALSIIIAWSANLNAHETSFTPCLPCLTSLQIAARRNKRNEIVVRSVSMCCSKAIAASAQR